MSLPYNSEKGSAEVPIDEKYGFKPEGAQHVETVGPDSHGHQNITADGVAHIDASVAAAVAANVEDYETLVAEAEEATRRETNMTLKEAFRTYPKVSLDGENCFFRYLTVLPSRQSDGRSCCRPRLSWRVTTLPFWVPSSLSVSRIAGCTANESGAHLAIPNSRLP